MSALPPKQLRMSIDADEVRRMSDVVLPDGYVARGYRDGDVAGWASLLQNGEFGDGWDEHRVSDYLEHPERREGSSLVEHDGCIVAATFASREYIPSDPSARDISERSRVGILDYVVTDPGHRGKGLGRATCTQVARFLVSRGCTSVSLATDDWRLPAIHLYLSLGFQPLMNREDMPERWASIYEKLKESGRDHS